MSNATEINSFMTDVRIALLMKPLEDPNKVVRMACQAMMFHGIYKGTDCEKHVHGGHAHPHAYKILRPAIEMHKQIVSI